MYILRCVGEMMHGTGADRQGVHSNGDRGDMQRKHDENTQDS